MLQSQSWCLILVNMSNYTGTKIIGHCGVDSGQILLIDPCYVYTDNFQLGGEPTGGPYDECCRITLGENKAGPTSEMGVVTSTAYGDGSYPVTAVYQNGRIVSVTINFDPQDEDDNWDDIDFDLQDEDDNWDES